MIGRADARRHENIISILDIIVPERYEDFKEVYLVQELMETDLSVFALSETSVALVAGSLMADDEQAQGHPDAAAHGRSLPVLPVPGQSRGGLHEANPSPYGNAG